MWERVKARVQDASLRKKVVAALCAVGLLVLGAVITTERVDAVASWAFGLVTDPFRSDPEPRSQEDKIVDEYLEQVENVGIWSSPPLMDRKGEAWIRGHFDVFNPFEVHADVKRGPRSEFRTSEEVLDQLPLLSGRPITVYGQVRADQVLLKIPNSPYVEHLLQIGSFGRGTNQLVYCRYTDKGGYDVPEGFPVVARGVILASGPVTTTSGGEVPAAFLACSSVGPYAQE